MQQMPVSGAARRMGFCLLAATGLAAAGAAAPEGADPAGRLPIRAVRWVEVNIQRPLPEDLLSPEGRTRWDLASLAGSGESLKTVRTERAGERLSVSSGGAVSLFGARDDGGEDAARWLYPDRFPASLRPGEFRWLEWSEQHPGGRDLRAWARVETVGIGWLHLPSGPRESVLQRALIRWETTQGGLEDRLLHRWVDPRAGTVAIIEGPAGKGGERTGIASVQVADEVLMGATPLRIYVDQLAPATRIAYGYDMGDGTTIDSLAPPSHPTMGDLLADDAWDLSGNTAADVITSFNTAVSAGETCNSGECGYVAGRDLGREDKVFIDPNGIPQLFKIHSVTETEVREDPPGTPVDTTIWLRAATINEGRDASSFGARDGESRICYESDMSETRSEVPLWRFPNLDTDGTAPDGWYMQAGDAGWSSDPFTCQQTLFNQNCGQSQPFDELYAKACTDSSIPRTGTQFGGVVKEGTLTLPSGHTFNVLVTRTVADFCVYLGGSCSGFSLADEVRTVTYLFQAPHLGTLVRLQSPQKSEQGCAGGADPDLCFTELDETDIKYGLFPPRSITIADTRDTEVDLAWDPGLITTHIDDFRIYWDTDSGGATSYGFDSDTDSGQVSFGSNSATVSGLTAGTNYFFTVTARSTSTNPSTMVATTYESLLFPTQVSGDPSFVYPAEVTTTTTGGGCIPTTEVDNLLLEQPSGDTLFQWDASGDPCLEGYLLLQAGVAGNEQNYSPFTDTGILNSFQGPAPDGFYLIVSRGGGGTGPTGHP